MVTIFKYIWLRELIVIVTVLIIKNAGNTFLSSKVRMSKIVLSLFWILISLLRSMTTTELGVLVQSKFHQKAKTHCAMIVINN